MKKMGLRARIIIITAILLFATNLVLGIILAQQSRQAMKTLIDERMLDVVNTASAMVDGDVIERLTPEDKGTPEWEKVMSTLTSFRENIKLAYIYCVYSDGNKHFTFGMDSDTEDPAEFGSPVEYTDALYAASLGEAAVDAYPYEDRWGRFYSAYSPVFNSKGEVAGVIAVDFEASWYEGQMNQNVLTIVIGCASFLAIGIIISFFLTRRYGRVIEDINVSLNDLEKDMYSLTADSSGEENEKIHEELHTDNMTEMGAKISRLRDDLRTHIGHLNTQANSMITAMASDYRSVYYVNLDEDDGVCFRGDPHDPCQTPQGVHFAYHERFTWYGMNNVTDNYREGFLSFIDPDNIREALAENPIIAYRYLAKREDREYYEMIRMAGVRRPEERDDHIVHAIGLGFTEIDTEMRETMAKNEALAEALLMAEEANEAKTSFLSKMSHEIRTPMNAIIGLDNLALHEESLSEQTRDYLEKIGGSARHLLGLINDILDMSRIESGRIVLSREEFSFSEMLEQLNTMVMSQARDKGLTYECRVLSPLSDYYIGDVTKVKEVLINILSNAIKFTDAPGRVTLTVERTAVFEDQTSIRFCIKDTGIGMDKEYIPKIFDPFSQEDSSRKNKYGSTGLGMAITKSIVEMMNGTISVQSEKGKGTEFTVVLTFRNTDRKDVVRENSVDHNKMHVLVIDDDTLSAEYAKNVLDEAGIRTDVCTDESSVLQMMELQHGKQEAYNLVLVNRKTKDSSASPEEGGDGDQDGKVLDMIRQIRGHYSNDATVIILTAYHWDDIVDEATAAGVDGFLVKPLFAANVISSFDRIARRNNMSILNEKKSADLTGRRILLAEDIELNAEIMMDILELAEVEADHAENGRIAVELFEKSTIGTYSAILMDIRMPEMDGLEAAAAIRAMERADAKNIPIIALTANAFDEDVQRSLQVGMNAHLSKPVEPEHLYETLGELIYEAENAAE